MEKQIHIAIKSIGVYLDRAYTGTNILSLECKPKSVVCILRALDFSNIYDKFMDE